MIDLAVETPIYLGDVPAYLPRHPRSGKRVAIQAVYRWAAKGVNGVRLEVVMIGGLRATTIQALNRFVAECTAAKLGTPAPAPRTSRQREAAIARAERELEAAGL